MLLKMSWCPTNKRVVLLTHSMKNAKSLSFKRIGTITFNWDWLTRLWNWKRSRTVLPNLQYQERYNKTTRVNRRRHWSRRNARWGRRRSSFSGSSSKLHLVFISFHRLGVRQKAKHTHFQWFVCAKLLHFQQLQWSHFRVQGNFALRLVWLWKISWWYYEDIFAWPSFQKQN